MRESLGLNKPKGEMKVNFGGIFDAPSTGLDFLMIDLSISISVGTRKMVNYA